MGDLAKARARGIYSTALTKLLLDNGFDITQPSITTRERFNLKDIEGSPDLDIYDRWDLQGVRALGKAGAVADFVSTLQSCLDDVVIRKWPFTFDGNHKGGTKRSASETDAVLLDIGTAVDVEFPALSKEALDGIRRSVVSTIDGHHFYKACGGKISSSLDMAERLLQATSSHEEVMRLFRQATDAEYPDEGSVVEIDHVKLDGRVLQLGKALIEDFDHTSSLMRLSRIFETKGIYDGLAIRRAPGDRAVTTAQLGEWHLVTRYFSREGRYKGAYINLNTPIELYPHGIRYVDLEVDVCAWPDGKVKRLDEDKLEKAVAEGVIGQKLVVLVEDKLQDVVSEIRHLEKRD